jgi:hypothetical protein
MSYLVKMIPSVVQQGFQAVVSTNLFPRKAFMFPSKVPIGSSGKVKWPAKIQVLQDRRWAQVEQFIHHPFGHGFGEPTGAMEVQ